MDGTAPELARRYFDAFFAGDRDAVDRTLADDFAFASPDDPQLDKAGFFERCWVNREHLHDFRLVTVVEQGDEAFVRYEARTDTGQLFHNMERWRTDGKQLLAVEVYYGPTVPQSDEQA